MNDLPVVTMPTDTTADVPPQTMQQSVTPVSYGGKEGESFPLAPKELPVSAVAQEIDVPKEVQAAGVSVQPTTVPLPQSVVDQGVVSVGHNVSTAPTAGSTIVLPLTNEQIENGLKVGVTNSIRWLAEWCKYQLKKMHGVIGTHHA